MSLPDPLTLSVIRLSFTKPRLLPRGTKLTAGVTAWEHSNDNIKITLIPRQHRVTIEITKGNDPDPFVRVYYSLELPSLIKISSSAPPPTMTYDGSKMMLKYGWPQSFRDGIQHPTEERCQIRLVDSESILQIARLLRPFFNSSQIGAVATSRPPSTATQEQRARPAISEESPESATKRQRRQALPESAHRDTYKKQTQPRSRSGSPVLPSYKLDNDNDDDDDSGRTVRLNRDNHYSPLRAPWENDRGSSQPYRPSKAPSPSLTTAVREMHYETLQPVPASLSPKAPPTPLIDLQADSQEALLVPGVKAPAWSNTSKPAGTRSLTPSEDYTAGTQVSFPLMPASPCRPFANHDESTNTPQPHLILNVSSLRTTTPHQNIPDASVAGIAAPSELAFSRNIPTAVNAAYDWSDEELEAQIDTIFGERGFMRLAERIAQILAHRSNHLHFGLYDGSSQLHQGDQSLVPKLFGSSTAIDVSNNINPALYHGLSDSQNLYTYRPVATSDQVSDGELDAEHSYEYGGIFHDSDDQDFDVQMNSA